MFAAYLQIVYLSLRHFACLSSMFVVVFFFWIVVNNVSTKWIREVKHFCPDVPYLLVGLKTDLREDDDTQEKLRQRNMTCVSYEEGVAKAKEIGTSYMECSSLKGEGPRPIFEEAVRLSPCSDNHNQDKNHGGCTLQ